MDEEIPELPVPIEDSGENLPGLTYADSGVDIDLANQAKSRIKDLARGTFTPQVLGDIGSFGGLFRPEFSHLQIPVMVSSVDGVGTKLKIAFMTGIHNTVGIDIVSHCVNDILVQGAIPLFFMDYIATGHVDPSIIAEVVEGLAEGCRESSCPLLGGETAEMPGFYADGEYDLAGFVVGLADQAKLLGAEKVQEKDVLLGLPSSGLHTNGYSLARKIFFELHKMSPQDHIAELGRSLGEELLEPHRNYLPILREIIQTDDLHALAHVTGGGLQENLDRILAADQDAVVEEGSWELPPIFRVIRKMGRVDQKEMYRTFNMGIGMVLVISPRRLDRVQEYLQNNEHSYFLIGEIEKGAQKVRIR